MKYKVLKECVLGGEYRNVGDTYLTSGAEGDPVPYYILECIEHGFLRLEKDESKVEIPGQYNPTQTGKYWSIDSSVPEMSYWYTAYFPEIAKRAAQHGISFKTQTECEEFLKWLKARATLIRDAKGFKPDWSVGSQEKWCVAFECYFGGQFVSRCVTDYNYGAPAFATREDAEASIKAHSKEWKVYLGVE